MGKLRRIFCICLNNVRKWAINPRIYILGILLVILVFNLVDPINYFSKAMNYRVTPWVFPFLTDSIFVQMLLSFGIVFLFCDAPFIDAGQQYFLIRSGRIQWGMGQVLYIMFSSAIFYLFVAFVSVLVITPNVFLSTGWGKILGTLAQTNAGYGFNIPLKISYQIQALYTPIQAFGLSLLLEWCVGTFLGLVIFIINIHFSRALGAIVAAAIVCLDMAISNTFPYYMFHFSPLSMARLSIIDPSRLSQRPTDIYVCLFFAMSVISLSIIAVLSVRKYKIQALPHV
jgi:hypothetical protein